MEFEKTNGLKVNHKKTEETLQFLIKKNLFRSDLKIKKDENYSYLPLKKKSIDIKNYDIVEKIFEKYLGGIEKKEEKKKAEAEFKEEMKKLKQKYIELYEKSKQQSALDKYSEKAKDLLEKVSRLNPLKRNKE